MDRNIKKVIFQNLLYFLNQMERMFQIKVVDIKVFFIEKFKVFFLGLLVLRYDNYMIHFFLVPKKYNIIYIFYYEYL